MDLDLALVDFLYRWHRTERPLGFDVIDLDVLCAGDEHPGAFADRAEAAAALGTLHDAVDGGTHPYVAAKIDACHAFMSALDGARAPFAEYVRRTLGVTPEWIDETVLERQHQANAALLDALGQPHTVEGVRRWNELHALTPDAVHAAFTDAERALVPRVKAAVGVDFDVTYRSEVVDEDAYWINWTATDEAGGLVLRFNTNARHTWLTGAPEYLALHEIGGHAVQATAWRHALAGGEAPRSSGLLAVFTPDMLLMEGLADTLLWFCPELPMSPEGTWATHRGRMEQLAWNNAHLMIADGAGVGAALAYVDRYAPGYVAPGSRAAHYEEVRDHPLLRGYLHSYAAGGWAHQQLAARLSPSARSEYLARAYEGPIAPAAIVDWPEDTHQK